MTSSHDLFGAAQKHIPGGVNSPVRAFRGVGGDPVFAHSGAGPFLFDAEGTRYIDYVGSWGPLILGHANQQVLDAIENVVHKGLSFGAPTELETRMAEKVCELVPSMDLVRMVSSGTEATMSAIRLARGFTGRDKIVKFEGCYHGHADSLLVKAGSGALTLGEPSSPGVPEALAELTVTLNYNDIEQVQDTFAQIGDQIACIIVEPVAGNMNCIPPVPGFLDGLREVCDQSGTVLIFDEVMTGFRVALGGAQAYYGVTPDLTTLGKVIGGGMPVGAFGGRREVMEKIAPPRPCVPGGNPIRQSGGHDRWTGDPGGDLGTWLLRRAEPQDSTTHRRTAGSGKSRWRGPDRQSGGRHVRYLLHRCRAGHQLCPIHRLQYRAISGVLPRHVGTWRIPGAVGLRGRLCILQPHRSGDRRHPGSGSRGLCGVGCRRLI